jgi:excisionase family DNA binding protein
MHDLNQLDDLLTVQEVAGYLKRSYKTTLKIIKLGKLKVTNDGCRGYRVSKFDLFNYLGYATEEKKPELNNLKKKRRSK